MGSWSNLTLRRRVSGDREPPNGADLLEALPVAVAALDREGVIRFVNGAWKRQEADFAPGTAYCLACEDRFALGSEGMASLENGIRNILAGEREAFSAEYSERSGSSRTRVCVSPLRAGDSPGVIVTHCRADSGLEEPEHRRQRDRMETVGRLAGGIAHDFANILTLILGHSEMILTRLAPDDPVRAEMEEIRKAARRGSGLTAQILDFTRGQAPEPRVLDLNVLLAEMETMLRPIIGEHMQLVVLPDPGLAKVRCDTGRMEQVIMNLVLNARDAMPRGGTITVRTANAELGNDEAALRGVPAGRYVALSFTDTGQGMDPATMARLFEPFFTTKEQGAGTGLGLSTVYGIVKQYGGDVWARSTVGAGTTFSVILPRTDAPAEAAGSDLVAPGRGAGTILLVEDEDSVRRLLKHVLVRQGYTVLEAANGTAALEVAAAQGNSIQLLLTDLVMPGMNGRELAEQCLATLPGVKVMFMSGYTNDVLVRAGALDPGMSLLQKPLRPETLVAKVREVLDGG